MEHRVPDGHEGRWPARPRVDLKDAVPKMSSIRLPHLRRRPTADTTAGRPTPAPGVTVAITVGAAAGAGVAAGVGTGSTAVAAIAAVLVLGCVSLAAVLM